MPWGRIWCAAAVLLAVLGISAEVAWRTAGHRASIVDDPDWWACHRGRIYAGGPRTVVLIGASRCQLDFSTETLRRMLPGHTVVQLAVDAHGPYEVLRDLAQDEAFTGVVICSTNYDGTCGYGDMSEYLEAFHQNPSLDRRLNRRVATWLQGRLAFINPNVQTAKALRGVLNGAGLPSPDYLTTHFDRSRSADYTMVHEAKLTSAKRHGAEALSEAYWQRARDNWRKRIDTLSQFVRRIQERGGEVVFVCLPTTGGYLSVYETETPKADYWDRFESESKAVAVHFQDVPTLSGYDCPDGSHLDFRDAPKFTEAFVNELVSRGVLPRE